MVLQSFFTGLGQVMPWAELNLTYAGPSHTAEPCWACWAKALQAKLCQSMLGHAVLDKAILGCTVLGCVVLCQALLWPCLKATAHPA